MKNFLHKTGSIETASAQPFYLQIKEALKQRILDGDYAAHEQLPSESELMKIFGVSRITVRQALRDLHSDGLVFGVQGKGTFVSRPKVAQDVQRLQGFGEAMSLQGYETSTRVLTIKERKPPKAVADAFAVKKSEKVVEIVRLRYLNREPISVDQSFFPLEIGRKLFARDLATDIFPMLENEMNLPLDYADLRIEATMADEETGQHLNVKSGTPVLKITRLVFTKNGKPIDFEYLSYRGDAYQYHLRIDRK